MIHYPETSSRLRSEGGAVLLSSDYYVFRDADKQIYDNLKSGIFCYVLAARQMGKSSLKVRVKDRLENDNYTCIEFDTSLLGKDDLSADRWYYAFIRQIAKGLNIAFESRSWWRERIELTPIARLTEFIEDIVLKQESRRIVVFIDEIDTLLNLDQEKFSTDDFFACIRAFFNARADNPDYNRLNFVIIGVATPGDLMRDKERTPFNIGIPVHVDHFKLHEAEPLYTVIERIKVDKEELMSEVFYWTNGQPVLTHQICNELSIYETEITDVKATVQKHVLSYYFGTVIDDKLHLENIEARLLYNKHHTLEMLDIYQCLLLNQKVTVDNSNNAQLYLKLSGIVIEKNNELKIACRIYSKKFDKQWVLNALEAKDRPLAEDIQKWIENNRDSKYAISADLVEKARAWAKCHDDLTKLELEYFRFLDEMEMKKNEKKQQKTYVYFTITAVLLIVAIVLGTYTYVEFYKTDKDKNKALTILTKALSEHADIQKTNERIMAKQKELKVAHDEAEFHKQEAINAKEKESRLKELAIEQKKRIELESAASKDVEEALRMAMLAIEKEKENPTEALALAVQAEKIFKNNLISKTISEIYAENNFYKTLNIPRTNIYTTDFSKKTNYIVSCSKNKIYINSLNGFLKKEITLKCQDIKQAVFFPNKEKIFASSNDNAYVFDLNGKQISSFYWPNPMFFSSAISYDGKYIATNSAFEGLTLWDINGNKIRSFDTGNDVLVASVVFSPVSNILLAGFDDGSYRIWDLQGNLVLDKKEHAARINAVDFSPEGEYFITGSEDKTTKLWSADGTLLNSVSDMEAAVSMVKFSPEGDFFLTGATNKTASLWDFEGNMLSVFKGHSGPVVQAAFSPNSEYIVTLSEDKIARVWYLQGQLVDTYRGHDDKLVSASFSPYGRYFITASADKKIQLWKTDGLRFHAFEHESPVQCAMFSNDGKNILSYTNDEEIILWNLDGKIKRRIDVKGLGVLKCCFSSNDKYIITANTNARAQIRNRKGDLLTTIVNEKSGKSIWSIAHSPKDNCVFTGSEDMHIDKWDIKGNHIQKMQGHKGTVRDLKMSMDGQYLISGSDDGTAIVWDFSGKKIAKYTGSKSSVLSVAISPSNQLIAIGTWNGSIRLYEFNGNLIHVYSGHKGQINSLDFSQDGMYILSSSNDKTAKLWHTKLPLNDFLQYAPFDSYEETFNAKDHLF